MGKGGGKCASKAQSACSSRTPRVPTKKSEKPLVKSSTQASKSSSSKEKVIDPDPSTLAPLIPKEESQPAAVEKINDDDDIDANVNFDQEEVDYPTSGHGGRLTGESSSEMPSVYNTANASPARSFSSGARSPDTVYLSGSEDIPHYIVSPVHPIGMPMTMKHSKAGANSPDFFVSSQRRTHNDEDQFLARWAPASSSSSAGPSGGVLRKRHSIAASSTAPLEVRSLTTSSSFPTPGGRVEEKPVQNIDSVNKTSDEIKTSEESESSKKFGHSVVEGRIAQEEEPKSRDFQGGEVSKETLGDNWEMVPAQHQSKGLGPEWVSVPTPNITDAKLHVPSSPESKKVESSEQVNERGVGKPREEPLEVFSSVQPVIPIADSVREAAERPQTPVQEENILNSVGSNQSDEIETRSLNGEGGDYVFLGTTGSLITDQNSQDPDLGTNAPEPTVALNKLASSSEGDGSPALNATLQTSEAEDTPFAHGRREENPTVKEDWEAKPVSKSLKEDEVRREVGEKGLASPALLPEEKDAEDVPALVMEEVAPVAKLASDSVEEVAPLAKEVYVPDVVEPSTSEPVVEAESGRTAAAEGVSSVGEAAPESLATPIVENLVAEDVEQDDSAVELQENDKSDPHSWRSFRQVIEKETLNASESPETTVAEETKFEELAPAADAQVETTVSAEGRELLGGLRDVEANSASGEVEVAPARVEEHDIPEIEKPTSVVEGTNAKEEVNREPAAFPLDINAADTALELQGRESQLPVVGSESVSGTISEVQTAPDLDAESPASEEQAGAVGNGTPVVQHDDASMDVVEAAPLGIKSSTSAVDTAQAEEAVASTSATANEVSEVQSRDFELSRAGSEPVSDSVSQFEGGNEGEAHSAGFAEQDAPAGDNTPAALDETAPTAVNDAVGPSADAPSPVAEEAKAEEPVAALPEEEKQSEASPVEVIMDSSVVDAGDEAPVSAKESVGEDAIETHAEVPAGSDASDAVDAADETGVNAIPVAESREFGVSGTGSEPVTDAVSEVEGADGGEADSTVAEEQDSPVGDIPVVLEEPVSSGLDSPAPVLESARDGVAVVPLNKDEEVDASPLQVVKDSSMVEASAEASPTTAEAVSDEVAGAPAEVPGITDASDAAATPDVNALDTAEQSREVEPSIVVDQSQNPPEAAPEVAGLTDVEGESSPVEGKDFPKVAAVAPGEDASLKFADNMGGLKDVE